MSKKKTNMIAMSVDNEVEKRFRKTTSSNVRKVVKLLEKGHNSGGVLYKSRDELHER